MSAHEEAADVPVSHLFPIQLVDVFPVRLHGQRHKVSPGEDTADLSPSASITGLTITEVGDTCEVELEGKIQFDSDTPPFSLEVMIVGIFKQVAPIPEDESLGVFTGGVAAVLLLPFLRQEIHALSAHLRLPPIILPVLSTQELVGAQSIEAASATVEPPTNSPRNRTRRPSTQ